MVTIEIEGNTYPIRENLKTVGWKWSKENKVWYRDVAETYDAIFGTVAVPTSRTKKFSVIEQYGGNKKGCRVTTGGRIIWQSKTYITTLYSPVDRAEARIEAHGDITLLREVENGFDAR